MTCTLRVHPHREGPWLVVLGRRRFAVPPEIGRRLLDLDGGRPGAAELARGLGLPVPAAERLLGAGAAATRRRGPRWRLRLVPATVTTHLAAVLAPWTAVPALALAAAAGAALTVACGHGGHGGSWVSWTLAAGLFAAGGLVHELGHAAALARAGYPPGDIGLGMMTVFPVLWCDVSPTALLPRRERIRIDLAGPALQAAAAGLLSACGAAAPSVLGTACRMAATWSIAAVAWSLTPLFRADAFWLLTDLAGVDDLDRLPRPDDPPGHARALIAFRLAHAGTFLAIAVPLLVTGIAAADAGPGSWLRPAAGLALGAAAVLRLAGLVRTLRRNCP